MQSGLAVPTQTTPFFPQPQPVLQPGQAAPLQPGQRAAPVRPRQGVYVRPEYMRPTPTPMIPPIDACQSQLYQGLIGQHEGAIYIAGLPGAKRILKPGFREGFEYRERDPLGSPPTLIEVRDYLPDQTLYVPSIRTVTDLVQLGPAVAERLTIELDQEGIVQEIRCG